MIGRVALQQQSDKPMYNIVGSILSQQAQARLGYPSDQDMSTVVSSHTGVTNIPVSHTDTLMHVTSLAAIWRLYVAENEEVAVNDSTEEEDDIIAKHDVQTGRGKNNVSIRTIAIILSTRM